MSTRAKAKGKAKMKDPPPPQKKFVEVFELEVKLLNDKIPRKGTYRKLMSDIRTGIIQRTESELEKADKSEPRTPQTVQGKPVLPITNEVFVVAVTSTDGKRVLFLFNWKDLYNTAFYTQECWYIYTDTNVSTLPPREQFTYVDVRGRGIFEMQIYSRYSSLGIKEIMLGPDSIDNYVRKLYNIRARLLRSSKKPKLDKELKDELINGPLTFGPVVISEPSRFQDFQVFMHDKISFKEMVPTSYAQFFTSWSKLCVCLHKGKGFTLTVDGQDDVVLTAEQVKEKIAIMLGGTYLAQ